MAGGVQDAQTQLAEFDFLAIFERCARQPGTAASSGSRSARAACTPRAARTLGRRQCAAGGHASSRGYTGVSGTAEACMEHFGLTSTGIMDLAREAMLKKPLVQHPPIGGGPGS